MQTRPLGPFTVSAIGLGAMPLSLNADDHYPEEAQGIATVHAALDAGVTFIDTADIYAPSWDAMGHNETIVGRAVRSYGGSIDEVVLATKGGITRAEGESWGRDGSLAYLRSAVEKSLRALQVEVIDLYQWHRPDRWMVYGEVIENFRTLQQEGKIKAIGISNANIEEIEVAQQVLGDDGLVSVQNEFSPRHTGSYRRAAVLRRARHRVPPLEPARWDRRRRPIGRRALLGVRRPREGLRSQPATGGARLGAVPERPRHPDPWCPPARVDHRLRRGGRPEAHRRRGPALLGGGGTGTRHLSG